jgi:transcription elongation GreA/GreB family factor
MAGKKYRKALESYESSKKYSVAEACAILGKTKGDRTTYTAPSGKDIAVEVIDIEPFVG